MAWPTDDLTTGNLDADADSALSARGELLAAVNKVKAILGQRGVAGGICELDGDNRIPRARNIEYYGVATNSGDDYSVTCDPAPAAYALGAEYRVKITAANSTTTPRLSINGLPLLVVIKVNAVAVAVGEMVGQHIFRYDGTNLVMLTPRNLRRRMILQEVQADYVASVAGTQTRQLNTVILNEITGASLSGGVITLPAGSYEIKASAPGYQVGAHAIELVAGGYTTQFGTLEYAGAGVQNSSTLVRAITFSAANTAQINHHTYFADARGLGNGKWIGYPMIAAMMEIIKRD